MTRVTIPQKMPKEKKDKQQLARFCFFLFALFHSLHPASLSPPPRLRYTSLDSTWIIPAANPLFSSVHLRRLLAQMCLKWKSQDTGSGAKGGVGGGKVSYSGIRSL